jgi:hypothetical protein
MPVKHVFHMLLEIFAKLIVLYKYITLLMLVSKIYLYRYDALYLVGAEYAPVFWNVNVIFECVYAVGSERQVTAPSKQLWLSYRSYVCTKEVSFPKHLKPISHVFEIYPLNFHPVML